ncbi:HutD family protein [Undibacterium arcticum]
MRGSPLPANFRVFPGIDRSLVVLDGGDLSLRLPGDQYQYLTPASAPYAFDGAAPISATLSAAAITDLNVMTRRDRCRHHLQRIAWSDPIRIDAADAGTTRLVFHALGVELHCHSSATGQMIALPAGGTLLLDAADAIELKPASAAPDARAMLYLIEITTR